MNSISSLVIISKEYPSAGDPIYPFVDELACAMRDEGVFVTVVAPFSLSKAALRAKKPCPKRASA